MAATNSGSIKGEQDSEGSTQSTADMSAFVQNLLVQMLLHFNCNVLDEMGSKIDELEQSINDLKSEMGAEEIGKSKTEEDKPSDEDAA